MGIECNTQRLTWQAKEKEIDQNYIHRLKFCAEKKFEDTFRNAHFVFRYWAMI